MLELFDTQPDWNVQEAEYQRLLGYPGRHVLEGRAREIADAARDWYAHHGRPWIYARQAGALELADGQIRIDGAAFTSATLEEQYRAADVKTGLLLAVSAGPQCEEQARAFWQEGKPDEYFFMEIFGSAVVEHLVTVANGRLCAWADREGLAALPHYSPGYSGWDVSDQPRLWELIRQTGRDFPGELDVLSTGMLRPKKSLLAIIGLTRHPERARSFAKLVPCENCSLERCQYRRAPYLRAPPQFEDARQMQPVGGGASPPAEIRARGLNLQAGYSVNFKALRKWSRERLRLETLSDGSIEARFRYEGTTCSNMGRPLEFDYFVILAPGREDYKIVTASCAPAPGDTGHTCQCEYLKDADSLRRAIAAEKPLMGRPLNDVLDWERASNPSGCYCNAEGRMHKWGLVFEVIHFALAQREKETIRHQQAATNAPKQTVNYDPTLQN